ncbi:MAG: response regulator [Caulobacteraceae bacterium]|nr:response regulator [Caulobacteraceae bacterium]
MSSTETLDTRPSILVVDDDAALRQQITDYLSTNGCEVESVSDAPAMDAALARQPFDIVVLDVMMPGEDGLSVCRRLSAAGSPAILMMSALGDDVDRIIGLEVGADDYLPKPCNPRELLARVRALYRRREGGRSATGRLRGGYRFAGYVLDSTNHRLRDPNGVTVMLTRGEYALLSAFLDRPGEVLSRDELLDQTHSDDPDTFDRAIDVQISRLRRKLSDSQAQELIRTVRGAGYKFGAAVSRA